MDGLEVLPEDSTYRGAADRVTRMKRTWMAWMAKIAAVAVTVATLGGLLAACGSSATATPIPTTDVGRSICATYFGSTASVAARFHIPTPVVLHDFSSHYAGNGRVHCSYRTKAYAYNNNYHGPAGYVGLGVLYGSARGYVGGPNSSLTYATQAGQIGAWVIVGPGPLTAAQKAWLKNTVLPRVAPPPSS